MELRHDLRLPVECSVQYRGDQILGEGIVVNLSTGGWLIAGSQPVSQGTPLFLRIALPDGQEPMEVELATVQWSNGEKLELKNIILGQDQWKRLRRFVIDNLDVKRFSCVKLS